MRLGVSILRELEHIRTQHTMRDSAVSDSPSPSGETESFYEKPDSKQTAQRLRIKLLAAVSKINRPKSAQVDWLDEVIIDALFFYLFWRLWWLLLQHGKGDDFKTFALLAYVWMNSDSLPSALATKWLQSLFTQLGQETLIFLASIWAYHRHPAIRTASLSHATAFIRAHSKGEGIDFQFVIPAMLIALQDEDKLVRQTAAGLLRSLVSLERTSVSEVYGLDTFYGDRSSQCSMLPLDIPLIKRRFGSTCQEQRSPILLAKSAWILRRIMYRSRTSKRIEYYSVG